MELPKIHLSSTETELMQNAAVILTKNSVLQKIKLLLEEIQQMQSAFVHERGMQTTEPFFISGKISRGENYNGLPYIILDYPRMSAGKDLFFCRTMFWWGHYFSSTLHLSGNNKTKYADQVAASYDVLQNYFIGVGSDQWEHHFEGTNYQRIGSMTRDRFIHCCHTFEHIKIAAKWPLDNWQEASSILFESWETLLRLCGLIA